MTRQSTASLPRIKRGTLLLYKGYDLTPSVEITSVQLRGRKEYDGGLPGVGFRWLKRRNRQRYFYPCRSVRQFFNDYRFSNLEAAHAE